MTANKYPLLTEFGIEVGGGNYNEVWVSADDAEKALETERARSAKLIEALRKYENTMVPEDGDLSTGVNKPHAAKAIAEYEASRDE